MMLDITDEEIDRMIEQADRNGDNKIDREEFCRLFG